MSKLRYLPASKLDSIIQNNLPVYIVNSSHLPSGDKGMIVITFYQGNRREPFKVPPTFIPIRMTDAIPPKMIQESRDFKQLLLKGMLTLVDPESAEDYLNTKEAQEEYEALVLSEHSARYQQVDLESGLSKRAKVSHTSSGGEGVGPRQDFEVSETVSNKVRGLVESLISGTMSNKEVLTSLKRHQSALSDVDLSFIASNVQEAEIHRWVRRIQAGTSKASPMEPTTAQPVQEVRAAAAPKRKPGRPARQSSNAFDFTDVPDADDGMTDSERAADSAAKARAMSEQAVYGADINSEIDKMLRG